VSATLSTPVHKRILITFEMTKSAPVSWTRNNRLLGVRPPQSEADHIEDAVQLSGTAAVS
jgi:hypothetical protein